eukprot:8730396-Karenia_brevis.AAC.1
MAGSRRGFKGPTITAHMAWSQNEEIHRTPLVIGENVRECPQSYMLSRQLPEYDIRYLEV